MIGILVFYFSIKAYPKHFLHSVNMINYRIIQIKYLVKLQVAIYDF